MSNQYFDMINITLQIKQSLIHNMFVFWSPSSSLLRIHTKTQTETGNRHKKLSPLTRHLFYSVPIWPFKIVHGRHLSLRSSLEPHMEMVWKLVSISYSLEAWRVSPPPFLYRDKIHQLCFDATPYTHHNIL